LSKIWVSTEEKFVIQVALFHPKAGKVSIEFDAIPLSDPRDYRCMPRGMITVEGARTIADDLAHGDVSGWLAGHRWFRQARDRSDRTAEALAR
jgi:hypothetical protein